MTWLVWRQHRAQFSSGAALLAAFAVLLVITGVQVAAQYHSALGGLHRGPQLPNQGGLFLGSHAVGFLVIATLGTPVLVGLFWGAPLVAAEAEAGTTQFAWMQSVTRKRWLTVKIGWMLLAAAVWGGVISALVTWWSGPNNALQLNAFDPGRFDIMGIVPVAYSLFAMALGITAGALLRRTLPAMAVTLAGFIAVRAVIALWLRPHYMSAVTVTYNVLQRLHAARLLLAARVRASSARTASRSDGQHDVTVIDGIPPATSRPHARQTPGRQSHPPPSCAQALSHFRGFLTYQPAGRYWAFQGIETGIFLVLAAALIAVTAVTLLRRDA